MKNICVITDNSIIYSEFKKIVESREDSFSFYYSKTNSSFEYIYKDDGSFKSIYLKENNDDFFRQFDLFLSLHCKQLFPEQLVENYRCINVHPGYNPYNRGWFPQVFSIINKKPVGVTIHEMDKRLDHGSIIYQRVVPVFSWDTSYDIYQRVLETEIELLKEHLDDIITNNYIAVPMKDEGNINYRSDFENLCKLDLGNIGSLSEHINILRATTFQGYDNAYFIDENGEKVYVSINLKRDTHN